MLVPSPGTTVHDLATAIIWFDNIDNIFCVVSKKGAKRTPETLEKNINLFKAKWGSQKGCVLMDVTHSSEISREGREFISQEFPKVIKALAIISSSVFGKMVANLFLTIKAQPYPIQYFTDEAEARNWLKQYV